jgi:hypothetical protein
LALLNPNEYSILKMLYQTRSKSKRRVPNSQQNHSINYSFSYKRSLIGIFRIVFMLRGRGWLFWAFCLIVVWSCMSNVLLMTYLPVADESFVESEFPEPSPVSLPPEVRELRYEIDPNSKAPLLSDTPAWPPFKIYVYPESSYHTTDCLYPPELPTRYVNTTWFWFQRMLEPTIHHQFMHCPILAKTPQEADFFVIPHYSRMCSGLDSGVRWNSITNYLSGHGTFWHRYSLVDHLIVHSVPHYGDKPADIAVGLDKAPVIGLLDMKLSSIKANPWATARSLVLPFITLNTEESFDNDRNRTVFVAMSNSARGMKAASATLRRKIEEQLQKVPKSQIVNINRQEYDTFKSALAYLPEGMGHSHLCIVPPGDAPSSKRFYDAISYLCIPYLLADYWLLPYEDVYVDYGKCIKQLFSRQVEELSENINKLTNEVFNEMRGELRIVKERFTWNYKEKPKAGQGLWTLSWALYDRWRMIAPYLNGEMAGDGVDDEVSITVETG